MNGNCTFKMLFQIFQLNAFSPKHTIMEAGVQRRKRKEISRLLST